MNMKILKELRERSGAGLQDCKRALEQHGDIEKAFLELQKQGLLMADSRENRETNEGLVFQRMDAKKAVMVRLACETDFAANSGPFREAGEQMLDVCFNTQDEAIARQKCEKITDDLRLKLREKLELKGIVTCTARDREKLLMYRHHTGRAGSIIRYIHNGEGNEAVQAFVLDLALQAVSHHPEYIKETDIPETVTAQLRTECGIGFNDLGKPAAMREKIISGMLEKRLDSLVMMRQRFVRDETQRVGDCLAEFNRRTGQDLRVLQAVRLAVG
ncbi:MAG: translation elongation factor Ts [Spirochaetales bacterium]|nr:translation elongation factor Ts [Spirochaetales bacterium]